VYPKNIEVPEGGRRDFWGVYTRGTNKKYPHQFFLMRVFYL
jgi:hypothetical protein